MRVSIKIEENLPPDSLERQEGLAKTLSAVAVIITRACLESVGYSEEHDDPMLNDFLSWKNDHAKTLFKDVFFCDRVAFQVRFGDSQWIVRMNVRQNGRLASWAELFFEGETGLLAKVRYSDW